MIGTILQARMGSTRLPGKVAMDLHGRPMIHWVIRRLQACQLPDRLIVATSQGDQDDRVIQLAEEAGADTYRGAEDDVLDRYYRCAEAHGFDYVVRATGDNPFVDPAEVDRLVELCIEGEHDFAIARAQGETGFPLGVGAQVFRMATLRRVWQVSTLPGHREHVDDYIHDHPQEFSVAWMDAPAGKRGGGLRLTVDTPEDLELARQFYRGFYEHYPDRDLVAVEWVLERLVGSP